MIFLFKIRKVENFQYETLKYLITSYYFSKIDAIKNEVLVYARREIHMIDKLRVNMLIKNDFIDLKGIFIDIINQKVYIENYKTSIIIIVRQRE